MKYSRADWAEKRKRGLGRYLLLDGILVLGGPFAVVMQVVGYFFCVTNRRVWRIFQFFENVDRILFSRHFVWVNNGLSQLVAK